MSLCKGALYREADRPGELTTPDASSQRARVEEPNSQEVQDLKDLRWRSSRPSVQAESHPP